MKKLFLSILTLLILGSCMHTPNNELSEIKKELSELNNKIDSILLSAEPKKKDSVNITHPNSVVENKKEVVNTSKPSAPKPTVPKKVIETKPSNDTLFHYYINGKVSVKFHPWKDEERKMELFDLYGVKTFEATEIRKSYSVGLRLSFHPNGSVSKIEEYSNPGASLYTYQAVMKFSTTNNPEIRTETRTPMYSIEEMLTKGRPYFWNKNEFRWVQQEIVVETNTPPQR